MGLRRRRNLGNRARIRTGVGDDRGRLDQPSRVSLAVGFRSERMRASLEMIRTGKRIVVYALTVIQLVTMASCSSVGTPPVSRPASVAEGVRPDAPERGTEQPAEPSPELAVSAATVAEEKPAEKPRLEITETRPERPATVVAAPRSVSRPGKESPKGTGDYRIGEEDELAISVYGDERLDKTQVVRPGGKISFPFVGEITAAGLTVGELNARLAEQLSRFYENPRVTVIVSKYNSRKVSVLGEVTSPGLLRLVSDIDLLEAVSRAGGLTANADLQDALLMRNGQVIPVDFVRLFKRGDLSQNSALQTGDVVLIPHINERKAMVLGQVRQPQVVPLRPGVTLVEAVSRAGGLTEDADLRGALLVRNRQVVPVEFERLFRDGDLSQDVLLEPEDVVLIPNIRDKKVFVLGQVHRPQVIPLTPDLTLIESISRAGGLTDDADLRRALLIRRGTAQPVDFERLIKRADFSQNALLQPNDVVLIPNVQEKKVLVLGEVKTPTALPLRHDVTLLEAISRAGGFTRDARKSNVVLIRGGLGNPKLMKIDIDALTSTGAHGDLALEPGDIVYVPRSIVANVVKFFQDVASILTPFVLAEIGIVLGPAVKDVFTGGGAATPPVVVGAPTGTP